LAPRHVGDVDQAIDILFDFDERAELGQIADLALDARADGILLGQLVPRVGFNLLEAQRDATRRGIDAEHHRIDAVADVENLRRMLDAFAPRHLRYVDQAFDARFQLDERAVVGQAHHLAAHARPDRITLLHRRPGILNELLVAERDTLGRRIVLEHDDIDFVVHFEQLGGMTHAPPRHVGDVEEAVDAAKVDECAVVGDVLDGAAEHFPFRKRFERGLLLLGVLFFEQRLARQYDVAALLVDLDDAHPELLPLQRIEVSNRTDIDLRARQERTDADVHREATLDPLDDATDHDLALRVGLLDLVPNLHLLGLLARQHDVAFAIFGALEQ